MSMNNKTKKCPGHTMLTLSLGLLLLAAAVPSLNAQSKDEFDSYKFRLEGYWVYSKPSGDVQGSSGTGTIDLKNTLGLGDGYSTFSGKMDWRFTRKNHLYFVGIPFNRSNENTLVRTIVFEGKTFEAGLKTQSTLEVPMYGLGYQYDIIRRKRGHLGIAVQANIFDTYASINAAAQVTGDGVAHAARSATSSLTALIPVAGPEFRLYLANSPRLFIDGNINGMYFFGYGNFVSATGALGFTVNKHINLKAGYQMGSRLVIKNDNTADRIGLRLTQKGPMAGVQISF